MSQAEWIKVVRSSGPEVAPPSTNEGATSLSPRPIRKRAFNRALKRGDLWLILPYCGAKLANINLKTFGNNKFAKIYFDLMCPQDSGYITWPFQPRGLRAWLPDPMLDLIDACPPSLWSRIKSLFSF